jgi:predicted Rdx family selenoprotein
MHSGTADKTTDNVIFIEICSHCQQHSWNTRHDESTYKVIAQDIKNSIQAANSDLDVFIVEMKGHNIGSFEIKCGKFVLFSKLKLKYFPHTKAVTDRILAFLEDKKNSNNLDKYEISHASPVKQRSHQVSSPPKMSPVKAPPR